jgi:ferredoxin-NADP reductase
LKAKDHEALPEWSPGSHIDVKVGTLGYRQYSLCSAAGNAEQ